MSSVYDIAYGMFGYTDDRFKVDTILSCPSVYDKTFRDGIYIAAKDIVTKYINNKEIMVFTYGIGTGAIMLGDGIPLSVLSIIPLCDERVNVDCNWSIYFDNMFVGMLTYIGSPKVIVKDGKMSIGYITMIDFSKTGETVSLPSASVNIEDDTDNMSIEKLSDLPIDMLLDAIKLKFYKITKETGGDSNGP